MTERNSQQGGVVSGAPLVSVVLPTHNMARFLGEALDSVLNQTYPHLEVHVIDDGSTDNPRAAIAKQLEDPRVHFYTIPQSGQGRAKNVGLRAARGEFVAFIDADDVWVLDKLERQLPLFDRPEIGVVYSDYARIDVNGAPLERIKSPVHVGRITNQLLIENFVTGMASVVRRECFERVGYLDEVIPMGIDYDLWLRISTVYEFAYLDYQTYLYRFWGGQMSRNFEKRLNCAIVIMQRLIDSNPGLIPPSVQNLAWAHTFVYAGNGFSSNHWSRAAKWYGKAIWVRPNYWPAWRQLALWPIRPVQARLRQLLNRRSDVRQ
jgi:glycosyltransferase involved in cell wall biosynthesis